MNPPMRLLLVIIAAQLLVLVMISVPLWASAMIGAVIGWNADNLYYWISAPDREDGR